jgi:hypothetical protein
MQRQKIFSQRHAAAPRSAMLTHRHQYLRRWRQYVNTVDVSLASLAPRRPPELSLKYGIYDLTQIHLQHSSGKYQRLSNQKNNCSAVRYRRHHNNESPRTN